MTARRERTATVLGSAVAGGLALFAGGQTWATFSAVRPEPLPPITGVLAGSAHAPLVPAAGLVLLAAAVAMLAVRGNARVVVGLLGVMAGAALVWTGVRALTGELAETAAAVPTVVGTPVVEISAPWPLATVVAGMLGTLAGLLAVLRGARWPGMGRRYERTAAIDGERATPPRSESDEDRAQLAWQALDRGEDPTDPAPGRRG